MVGCCLDQNSSPAMLAFFKNGRRCLPATGSRAAGVAIGTMHANAKGESYSSLCVPPAAAKDYCLVPAVCLYTASAEPIRVALNFTGPFEVRLRSHCLHPPTLTPQRGSSPWKGTRRTDSRRDGRVSSQQR